MTVDDKLRSLRRLLHLEVNKVFRLVLAGRSIGHFQVEQIKAAASAVKSLLADSLAALIFALEIDPQTDRRLDAGQRRVLLGRIGGRLRGHRKSAGDVTAERRSASNGRRLGDGRLGFYVRELLVAMRDYLRCRLAVCLK